MPILTRYILRRWAWPILGALLFYGLLLLANETVQISREIFVEGAPLRPGLIAGLHGRIAAHREPPEPVPFVVYERAAPRFLPVPTRPVGVYPSRHAAS